MVIDAISKAHATTLLSYERVAAPISGQTWLPLWFS